MAKNKNKKRSQKATQKVKSPKVRSQKVRSQKQLQKLDQVSHQAVALGKVRKPRKEPSIVEALRLCQQSWVAQAIVDKKRPHKDFFATLIVATKESQKQLLKELDGTIHPWEFKRIEAQQQPILQLAGAEGPLWVLRADIEGACAEMIDTHSASEYARYRDMAGSWFREFKPLNFWDIQVSFLGCSQNGVEGFLVGLDVASYSYRDIQHKQRRYGVTGYDVSETQQVQLYLTSNNASLSGKVIDKCAALASATNVARHLVNLPANTLNPTTYAQALVTLFGESKMQVEVWDASRLKKEGMGLHLAVGQAAEQQPCLVHLRYRPKQKSSVNKSMTKKAPLAFVGKGITFDSGGLDIKPSAGMRTMKKDMGGSAAVVGLASWVEAIGLPQACDFYLALAENAVAASSFRPGDVLTARNGTTVEIHNTDAEGRLVLADALDVACTQKDKDEPEVVIDVATLTGAVKVGLGSGIAGLFSNSNTLAEKLFACGLQSGDPVWHLPLMSAYKKRLKSSVADMQNCTDGFGGAITAALFLQHFVGTKTWAHLDIYAWKDGVEGACSEAGGSGQAVQCLAQWMATR